MSGDDDRPGWVDREKKSFSELDRARREKRDGRGGAPRSAATQARAAAASKEYRKQIDGLFRGGKAAEVEKLAEDMREARGSAGFAAACRVYRDAAGPPTEVRDIACFLDAGDSELVLFGLEALRASQAELSSGLRTQLRMLAEDPDDAVAEAAEDLLDGI